MSERDKAMIMMCAKMIKELCEKCECEGCPFAEEFSKPNISGIRCTLAYQKEDGYDEGAPYDWVLD